jgi:acyl-CoA reductase-like NAD-dependent aldehyde dehydrogenase
LKGVAAELKTINPATEEIINRYQIMTQEQINDKVKKARNTFHDWKKDAGKRTDLLHDFANELRNGKENLARTATTERGKVIKEARSEVEKCAWVIEYYADNGRILSTDEIVNTDARKTVIKFQPIGVIGSIMPWKIPYWQALRFAAPSLVIGNTIVLKSASATTQCGIEIEKSFNRAGLPEGVFQTLVGDSSIAGPLIDSDINAVTFTGSVPAGAKVAQRATSQVKKTVLELGGSDPFIVCEDADIEKASTGAIKGRFINCGQSCIASKRFIVVKNIANEFVEKFIEKAEGLRLGDPLSDNTDIGPLVNANAIKKIDSQVKEAVKEGAEVLVGGEQIGKKGYFYKPTVLRNVNPKMSIAQEEVFGPLAPIIVAGDEVEAIELANDSEYGLGASIWTQDLDREILK